MAQGKNARSAEAAGSGPGDVEPPVSFEVSAERLTEIVRQLEGGELALEASLKLFEEGVTVARAAQERLEQAERRVEELLGLDAQGAPEKRTIE